MSAFPDALINESNDYYGDVNRVLIFKRRKDMICFNFGLFLEIFLMNLISFS